MTLFQRFIAFFRTWGERLDLMKQMFHITGAIDGLDNGPCGDNNLRSAIVACLGCPHAAACAAWSSAAKTPSLPPEFCWNASRLRRMTSL